MYFIFCVEKIVFLIEMITLLKNLALKISLMEILVLSNPTYYNICCIRKRMKPINKIKFVKIK